MYNILNSPFSFNRLSFTPHRMFGASGTDTTVNGICQTLQFLTQYPDVQEKLRAEIARAQEEHGNEIPYNTLLDLPYLDAVCRESLRL